MDAPHPRAHLALPRYPISAIFAPFPLVCFTLTLLSDVAYWRTSNLMWHEFSSWLLLAGLVVGGIGVLAGLIDLFRRRTRLLRASWASTVGFLLVLALGVLNSFVHAGDGWTAIVPYGLTVSAVTVLLIVITVWLGRSTARFSRVIVGVSSYD